jgi:hypothetical protein
VIDAASASRARLAPSEVAAAQFLYGTKVANTVRAAFVARRIL